MSLACHLPVIVPIQKFVYGVQLLDMSLGSPATPVTVLSALDSAHALKCSRIGAPKVLHCWTGFGKVRHGPLDACFPSKRMPSSLSVDPADACQTSCTSLRNSRSSSTTQVHLKLQDAELHGVLTLGSCDDKLFVLERTLWPAKAATVSLQDTLVLCAAGQFSHQQTSALPAYVGRQ